MTVHACLHLENWINSAELCRKEPWNICWYKRWQIVSWIVPTYKSYIQFPMVDFSHAVIEKLQTLNTVEALWTFQSWTGLGLCKKLFLVILFCIYVNIAKSENGTLCILVGVKEQLENNQNAIAITNENLFDSAFSPLLLLPSIYK